MSHVNVTLSISYDVIPDGVVSDVDFVIKGRFNVPTMGAQKAADEAMSDIAARVLDRTRDEVRQEITEKRQSDLWMGQGQRPKESS